MAKNLLFNGNDMDPKNLWEAVYQTMGAASVCWEDLDQTGVFDEKRAGKIASGLLAYIQSGRERNNLSNRVADAIDAASTCWESLKGTGEFDEKRANQLADELIAYIERGK